MCMSAILWSGIGGVVYGTSIPSLKRFGWHQIDLRAADVIAASFHPGLPLTAGIQEAQCDALFLHAARSAGAESDLSSDEG